MPQPNGYRKAMRFMRHANKFGLPIITFVDTPGAYAGKTAEELGQVGLRTVCGHSRDLQQSQVACQQLSDLGPVLLVVGSNDAVCVTVWVPGQCPSWLWSGSQKLLSLWLVQSALLVGRPDSLDESPLLREDRTVGASRAAQ